MTNKITINLPNNSNIDKEMAMSLNHLCLQIQKEFDISPLLIEKLINNIQFIGNCNFLFEQCQIEMIMMINKFKEKYNLMDKNNIIQAVGNSEKEKCGNLIKNYNNGYIEYCNLHKYLHPHPEIKFFKPKQEAEVNHEFVTKNEVQVSNEYYKRSIYAIYQNYINKLHNLFKSQFYFFINQVCEIKSIKIDENNLKTLTDEMEKNPTVFKSKVLYEYINTSKDKQSRSDLSYYYLKVYRCVGVTL